MATNAPVTPDSLITIKVQIGTENRRFKVQLRDLGASTLPDKLRHLLAIPITKTVVFERYSDSAGSYVVLDSANPSIYKQLYRAAKAKLKLRIKATIIELEEPKTESVQLDASPHVRPINHARLASLAVGKRAEKNSASPAPANGSSASMAAQSIRAIMNATDIDSPYTHHNLSGATLKTHQEAKVEAPVVPKREIEEEDAPVPRSFSEREQFYKDLEDLSKLRPTTLRAQDQSFHVPLTAFTVQCNSCSENIPGAHFHCSICEDGDYDLCQNCVEGGVHCEVDDHFLIKRLIEHGRVVNSTMEKFNRKSPKIESEKEVPGAFMPEVKEETIPEPLELSRTCNCCVNSFEESNFVTCLVCDDYDLCIPCHVSLKHGHHPNHTFAPTSEETTLDSMASALCAPGRNMRHFATCDECDKDIYGVRHKCLTCPDWDFCSTCIKGARHTHPGHRFVAIYETIAAPTGRTSYHHAIRCDGPLCKNRTNYIRGDRYKCAVCHDTDFCANCEALPHNSHNRTHPLIKFRTPVRNVSVTTFGEKENGEAMATMGDKLHQMSSKSTETTPAAPSANAATQVQTVAEVKPVEQIKEEILPIVKEEPLPIIADEPVPVFKQEPKMEPKTLCPPQLAAQFVRDKIVDGSKLPAGQKIDQIWVMRNPGPMPWPAGCSVSFTGGDNMLNIDSSRPSSISDLDKATQSNIVNRVVGVGEEIYFSVLLKMPQRTGKAISYWRLKTADGMPFGHKLWCDVVVEEAAKDVEASPVKVEEHELGPSADEEQKPEQGSQMIFPTLEKESPESSTYAVSSQNPEAPSSIATEERETLDDLEGLELGDDETDDGFLTDEEYEILDMEANEEATNGKK